MSIMRETPPRLIPNSSGNDLVASDESGARSVIGTSLRSIGMIGLALSILFAAPGVAPAASANESPDPWPGLVRDVFNGRSLADGTGLIAIEMPAHAEDAAIVPVTLRATLPPGDTRTLKAFTLVIDNNPAPVAASFKVGPGVTAISTRVRVNSFTNVHAVAELSDGGLYVVQIYVKASGGCSAPMAKNPDEAKASLGQMRFRQFAPANNGPATAFREAQIMIRHPQNSGLQRDQVTLLYIPLFIIRDLRVWQGDQLVLEMDGGISISEDPNIRFSYQPNGAATFRAEATDTDGHVFKGEWPADQSM
jgi:sulfur-oxidizing protein SoxY